MPGSGDSWFADPAKSGGIALDLHIHDLDYIQYLFGNPVSVEARTAPLENGAVGHIISQFNYGPGKIISATASWLMPESYGFSMTFNVIFEKGAVFFDGSGLKVYPSDGEAYAVNLKGGDGYTAEIRYFHDLVQGEVKQPVITPEEARESVRIALAIV